MTCPTLALAPTTTLAFIGGGNMASAIIGGLIGQGLSAGQIQVVEPWPEACARLTARWPGLKLLAQASASLTQAQLVVWAVKPQTFKEAALAAAPHTHQALHLSVAAGIRSDSLMRWLDTQRLVRAMPNTPALVGQGMTGLYACDGASAADRALAQQVVATTGQWLWVEHEPLLDAVTALSGSGPAYVFYFLQAMRQAGTGMGLSPEQAYQLAVATFAGAAELARRSDESPEVLRERVTSKGGTTYAALAHLEAAGVKTEFIKAMRAAQERAKELGDSIR